MSMEEIREGREAVETWFRRMFPDAHVEVIDDPRTGALLVRAQTEAKRWCEIEFPDEALEDYRATIVDDLERQNVGALLRDNPCMRFTYNHLERRVPPIEQRKISCGGRNYLVTRQPGGLVSILEDGERIIIVECQRELS
ncbi:MAG: hypothetical protein ACREMD_14765 [Gemmatimonadota bacterium]